MVMSNSIGLSVPFSETPYRIQFNSIQFIKFRNTIIHEHTLLYKDLLSATGYHL